MRGGVCEPQDYPSGSWKIFSIGRRNTRDTLKAKGRLGSYFSVSIAFTVWRETPRRWASSPCDQLRSARRSLRRDFTGI